MWAGYGLAQPVAGDGGYIYMPTTDSITGANIEFTAESLKAFKEVISASGAVGFQLSG